MNFKYYYGVEAEQFSFYRIPRLLIKDERFKGLSNDAKLLYGLMLDRMAMSIKNSWLDDENRVYIIYTIETIREDLGCSKEKAVKILAELDSNKGIGLVERIRRGLGKPDIIYVKNFAITDSEENRLQEVGKSDFKKSEKPTSGGQENRLQEVGKSDSNYNNINYNNMSYTNLIYQSDRTVNNLTKQNRDNTIDRWIDTTAEASAYKMLIHNNLEYEHHMKYASEYKDIDLFQEIYELICDVVCIKRKTIRINGEDCPYELVKSRFLKINSGHVEYVINCMRSNKEKIINIRAYLITALYNAPTTINHYYQQEVQHDLYGAS